MTEKLQGRPAAPDAKAWLEYIIKLKQDAPARYEDAAKFLATIISLTITILFTAFEKLSLLAPRPIILFFILFFWLAALLLAFLVLFPRAYPVSSSEIAKIKAMQEKIIKTKKLTFTWAVWLYFAPLAVLVFFYLLFALDH